MVRRVFAAVVLAVALALDAAAASAVCGVMAARVRVRDAIRVAVLTGVFQGAMAALGWLGGRALGERFARYDHWIAFGLLAALGGKTILGALRRRGAEESAVAGDPFAWGRLVVLAIATSIDALAAGVSIPLLGPPPAITIALVAGVTFALSLAAVYTGRAAGARLGRSLELAGGAALIAIGVKILVEHLS
jgi:manganese efflux pump family protein